MAGTLTIKVTRSSGESKDVSRLHIWSGWFDGRLLGQGHAFRAEEAEERAMNLVVDLLDPDEVDHIEIIEA